jgi:hypothetical protein
LSLKQAFDCLWLQFNSKIYIGRTAVSKQFTDTAANQSKPTVVTENLLNALYSRIVTCRT